MIRGRAWKRQLADRFGLAAKARGNKFGAVSCAVDGIRFDSQAEARYYGVCKDFPGLQVHPTIELIPGVKYKPDFSYEEGGRRIWIDVKGGHATSGGRFPTVKKIWRHCGPGPLHIVTYDYRRGTFAVTEKIHPTTPEAK